MPNLPLSALQAASRYPEAKKLKGGDLKELVEALVPPEERMDREAGEAAFIRIFDVLREIFDKKKDIPFSASSSTEIAKEIASVLFLDEPEKIREVHRKLDVRAQSPSR